MAQLAMVHGIGEKPEHFRVSFSAALGALKDWFQRNPTADGSRAVGVYQPFYLAYHELDNRALLSQYGDLCADLMQTWFGKNNFTKRIHTRSGPIRVGIVSGQRV